MYAYFGGKSNICDFSVYAISMKRISRKKFIRNSGLSLLAGTSLITACKPESKANKIITAPNIITEKKYRWRMVTTWPPNFPVLGEVCNMFAEKLKILSNGRLELKVYGGGELVPPLESFEAVMSGAAEMYNGCSYYWAGKVKAAQFFASIPFGMNAQQMHAWIMNGGGYPLWRELYADLGLIPFIAGNTGVQMGGWFNKKINNASDLKGLKMRLPGLGGKVLEKAGGAAVLVSGGELYTSMERGVIDATEWIGPYHDYLMGLHKIAKYYYSPGWHEPGSVLETVVNKSKYDALPPDLQMMIQDASHSLSMWCFHEFEAKNNQYLNKIRAESDAEFRKFPKEVLDVLRSKTTEVLDDIVSNDPKSAKIYASFKKFAKDVGAWSEYSEKAYYQM